MQKKRYKDNYGGGLSISKCQTGGYRLKCWIIQAKCIITRS